MISPQDSNTIGERRQDVVPQLLQRNVLIDVDVRVDEHERLQQKILLFGQGQSAEPRQNLYALQPPKSISRLLILRFHPNSRVGRFQLRRCRAPVSRRAKSQRQT
jgi:hypothetical protein